MHEPTRKPQSAIMRRATAIASVLLIAFAAACGTDGTSSTAPAGTQGNSTPGQESGISAEEAKRRSVFVGPYDAKLDLRDREAGHTTLTLRNVGTKPDSYSLRLDPPSAGTLSPAQIHLAPGKEVSIRVDVRSQATVKVNSHGRNGAEITDAPVAP